MNEHEHCWHFYLNEIIKGDDGNFRIYSVDQCCWCKCFKTASDQKIHGPSYRIKNDSPFNQS